MEHNTHEQHEGCTHCGSHNSAKEKKGLSLPVSILLAAVIIGLTWSYVSGENPDRLSAVNTSGDDEAVDFIPASVEIPVTWGNLGKQLVETGVLDKEQFYTLYESRGGIVPEDIQQALEGTLSKMVMTEDNAAEWLNVLWALGLGNQNSILTNGPMNQYGDTGGFASTGGWSLSKGDAMDHYARHMLMALTPAQQALVERVSQGIYRPCCDNATYFPDCNHGMAMLGLIELMASRGMSEKEMYAIALKVNSYWFPQNYATIAKYYQTKGIDWDEVDPVEALGKDFSSGSGYARVRNLVTPPKVNSGGGGCGV